MNFCYHPLLMMNYPVLKVSVLAQVASVALHLAVIAGGGWWLVRHAQFGMDAGRGGAVGLASRRMLQAEVEIAPPRSPADAAEPPASATISPSAPDLTDEPLPAPEADLDMMPVVVPARPASAARTGFNPSDLPVSAVPKPNANPPRQPLSVGSAGALAGKLFAAGDGGAQTSAQPAYLRNLPPVYPTTARERGQEGRVVLSVTVSAAGVVGDARVKKSSGHALLDEAALAAVKKWQFKPATRRGRPIEETIEQSVVFSLKK
ncbi:MAG: energy transducer TonB [Verrucomicrobiales bacterium]|nr:energy transducer TonB [Verrucomicrobiales bacterium]